MHLVETMAYAGEKPWHGLGNRLAPRQSIEVWKRQAGMEWKVLSGQVMVEVGGQVMVSGTLLVCLQGNMIHTQGSNMPDTRAPVEDFTTEIEDSRHLFAWCLVRYGQIPEALAIEQARERYPDQAAGHEYEHELLFHDEPWHWAMLHVLGEGYWYQNPELLQPSLEYDTESDALCLARGEPIPLLDEDEYLGALAHARHMHAWTLIHQAGIDEEQAQRQALEYYAYFPPHHRWRMCVHDARAAWVDVMSVLHINDYWSRPELQRPPEAYWRASRAFALAQGLQLPEIPPPS